MNRKWVYNGVEFKVGDTVRVMRQEEDDAPNGMGDGIPWENSWIGGTVEQSLKGEYKTDMDAFLGLEFVIEDIDFYGVTFEDSSGYAYAFPLSSLDKVKEAA